MSKRAADEADQTETITVIDSGDVTDGVNPSKSMHLDNAGMPSNRRDSDDEMGEFEDPWEDEMEEEEIIINNDYNGDEDEEEEQQPAESQVLDETVQLEMMENEENNDDAVPNKPAVKVRKV
jgi:hypothetical protein